MNRKLLLISISLVTLCSCSSVYKSGQTPDDVYFSPVRTAGYNDTRQEEDKSRDEANRYQTTEERQIRMGINDRRWRSLDNYYYDYTYTPYNYGYNYSYYYNPFYCNTPVYNPVVVVVNNPKNTTPRKVNLGGYGNGYNNTNAAVSPKYSSRPASNNRNSGLGSVLSKVFSSGSSNNSNSNSSSNSSNRSYTPSSSSNSSGGSKSSSSGGSVSRPARNGKG